MPISTFTKSGVRALPLVVSNAARALDANHDNRISLGEVDAYKGPGKRYLKALHAGAVTAGGLESFVSANGLYAYVQGLLPGIRTTMDTRGNDDAKLQDRELRYLSTPARNLVRFAHAIGKAR